MGKRPAPGTFAWWLKRARKARYPERQRDAIADIKRLTGVSISASEFAQWESGSREPRHDNPKRQVLYDFFGGTEADEQPDAPEGVPRLADLIDAIAAQTDAITRLVSELQAARGLSSEVRERVAALEAYAAEHERRLQADRQLMGLAPAADEQSGYLPPVGSRP